MAIRDSLWVQASGPTGMLDVEETRVGLGALLTPGSSGVVAKSGFRNGPGTSPGSVFASGTPDAFVHVAPFQLMLQTSRAAVGGVYIMTLDAQFDVNILSTPADSVNPRNDLVIAQQSDTFYTDAVSTWTIRQVVGTPSGSPADPSVSGSTDYVTLARVRVNANATTITNANITDLRAGGHAKSLVGGLNSVALGGLLPVASQAQRDALTGIYDGLHVYRQDRDWIEVYDGAAFRVQGVARVTSFADLSAVSNPATGQLAVNTADGTQYRYDGSAWVITLYRVVQKVTGSPVARVTFSSIPTSIRVLTCTWTARGTSAVIASNMRAQVNNDNGTNYDNNFMQVNNSTVSGNVGVGVNVWQIGVCTAGSAAANNFGSGELHIPGWNNPHSANLNCQYRSHMWESAANSWYQSGGGLYFAGGPFNRLDFFCDTGNIDTGSEFLLTGRD